MIDKAVVEDIVQEFIGETDMFLVDISIAPGNVIHIQLDDPKGISIDKCVELNRVVLEKLDREIEDYELQVSSPGIGLPFKVLAQYLKNIGRTVEVLLNDGQKLKGILRNANEEEIEVEVEKKVKLEGKKRPELITESLNIQMNKIKSTKELISFK
jgi:ribosome maturation factor RimP